MGTAQLVHVIFSRDLTAFRVVAEVTDSSSLISLLLAC